MEPWLFNKLQRDATVDHLIAEGIISLVRSKRSGTALQAGAFVGDAVVEGIAVISVTPKVPGALRALLDWSVPKDLRVTDAPSLVDRAAPLLDIFLGRFLHALARYLTAGRVRTYTSSSKVGSVPRGRLDIGRTIKWEARGHAGRLAYEERRLTANNSLNRFLALSLFAAAEHVGATRSDPRLLARTRSYMALFEDVEWLPLRRAGVDTLESLYRDAYSTAHSDSARMALAYGRAIVLNLGSWPEDHTSGVTIPNAFFLSLERLFEDAVRNVMMSVEEADKGFRYGSRLFPEIESRYVADPDIVIGKPPEIIIDTKFREFHAFPAHADVYQLHAHARAFGVQMAALIYPMQGRFDAPSRVQALGTSVDGVRIVVAEVDLARVEQGTVHVLEALRRSLATA